MDAEQQFQATAELYQSGDLSGAERHLESLIRTFPDNPNVLHLLSLVRLRLDKAATAADSLKKLCELAPGSAEAHELFGVALRHPETLTDLERAARFLYLQRTAFGGKVSGRNFGVSPGRPGRFDITKLAPMLEDLHSRLSGVVIKCLPFKGFIRRHDRPGTLFHLDPPYWGRETDHGKDMFSRADFERLAGLLETISGRFPMSLNDTPEVRETFSMFDIEAVETTYTVGRKKESRGKVGEVIISNRPPAG